jgi:Flp pilus assembly protein CpaB
MENRRAIIISIICVLVSMLLISAYQTVREKELTASFGEEVDVVIADGAYFDRNKTDFIPEYTTIESDMLKTIKVFKNYKQPLTASKPEDVVGKATFVPISLGEQITLTKLVHPDGKPVLDQQVEKKTRAVTIMVSQQSGVSRLIRPGNRVDVLIAPVYDANGTTILEVKTLIQNAVVLATGKHLQNEVPTRVDRDLVNYIEEANTKLKRKDLFGGSPDNLQNSRPDDNYNSVTLQLSMEDAEKLVFLTHKFGDKAVYLTLRNATDPEIVNLGTTLLDDVLGPNSDYGRSKRRPAPITPPKARYQDLLGNTPIPRY